MSIVHRVVFALLCVLAASGPAVSEETLPFSFRLVPIVQGNRESSFGDDEARWLQTPVAKAAAVCGVDVRMPEHPLVVHSYKKQRLFYLFYNTIDNARDEKAYVIQRIKRTIKDFANADDRDPKLTVTHLVEVMKIKNFSFRPDQHFGNFGLGTSHRREIVKECEIGFGEVQGKAEGNAWPFDPKRLYEVVQPQAEEPGLYDKVEYSRSRTWKITAWFDRDGNYGVHSPEMGIDAPNQLPDLKDGKPAVKETRQGSGND